MLAKVEEIIHELVEEIGDAQISELFSKLSGGKRLRARLILAIAPTSSQAPLYAAIIELIHAASLLHDDVIDEAMIRRGTPSVNATHGSKIAIMLGDVLYSKAYSALTAFDPKIAFAVSESVTRLSVGEMMDVNMASSFNTNRELYLKMLYLKTATLIEASAYGAAMLEGKDPASHAVYGKNLGLAFQIVDDILDITSDEITLGKPALNDFIEGKTTLPYIDLYDQLDSASKERLKNAHAKELESDEKEWIRSQMAKYGVIEKSYQYAKNLCDEAMNAIGQDSKLQAILETVIQRSH